MRTWSSQVEVFLHLSRQGARGHSRLCPFGSTQQRLARRQKALPQATLVVVLDGFRHVDDELLVSSMRAQRATSFLFLGVSFKSLHPRPLLLGLFFCANDYSAVSEQQI